jgi:hypothetical protein
MVAIDWYAWHRLYNDPTSKRAQRLAQMQEVVLQALQGLPDGPIDLLSLCAGQGREIVGALQRRPRPGDVNVRMIELDPRNAEIADRLVREAGAGRVETVVDDAGLRRLYAGAIPVDLLLLCGVFGNLVLSDIERCAAFAASAVRPDGLVVWTRHRGAPDCVPAIRSWFTANGFVEEYVNPETDPVAVVLNRYAGPPRPLAPQERIFTFVTGVVPPETPPKLASTP